jgi:signal transduction histidine kinase
MPRVSVNQILGDVQELIGFHPSAQNNDFEVRKLPEDASVQMNGTDLLQILLNLTVNAFQCSQQRHKVGIEAKLLQEPLKLTTFKDTLQERMLNMESFENTPPILALAVRDNGPGISSEVLPQIFNPYFTTKSPSKGTGLGLSIVLRLVKRAGGALHVHTKVGEGTTFTVYLPTSRPADEPQKKP